MLGRRLRAVVWCRHISVVAWGYHPLVTAAALALATTARNSRLAQYGRGGVVSGDYSNRAFGACGSASNVGQGRKAKWPPLLRAAYDGDTRAVQELRDYGADVNCTMAGAGQKTPFYCVVRFELPEVVRILLSHPEIDVHLKMKSGRGSSWTTPLEAAKEAAAIYTI